MGQPDRATQVVVCDADPIIHLDEIGCLSLLADFPEVLVADAVWQEIDRHRPSALTSSEVRLIHADVILLMSLELQTIMRIFALHTGELEAIQLASDINADLLLTDDMAARFAAQSLGIPVHGTLGLLLRTIRRGQRSVSEVVATLESLPALSTLHVKRSLIDEILLTLKNS